MEELDSDAARDWLLDEDDKLVGRVKDVKEVEKRLRHVLLRQYFRRVPRTGNAGAWRFKSKLIRFFNLLQALPSHVFTHWQG
jgi:hypothetical protein